MSPEPHEPLGTLFGGRYRLRGLLGVGGSASVYEADDLEQLSAKGPARVAVKILHPHLCATEESRAAFLREAHRAGQLRHPNIVAVREYGLHDASGMTMAWIALDYVEGPTLADWVEAAGPLPPVAAASVVRGILAGLGHAHAAGLVHRDVSPRNVILEGAGVPGNLPLVPEMARILDFGLSDLTGRTTVGTNVLLSEGDEGGTAGVVGNPEFMSPEQARGRAVTAAGDLYQVGALLYFLLTGQPPYPRASAELVLAAHLTAPPPVPSALVGAARPLDRVVTRAMAKEPADRFPDGAGFAEALDGALSRAGTTQVRGDPATYSPTRVMAVAARPELRGSARAQQHGVPLVRPSAASGSPDAIGSGPPPSSTRAQPGQPSRNPAATIAVAAIAGVALLAVLSTFAAPTMAARPSPSALTSTPSPAATTPTPTPTRASPSAEVTVPTLHGTLTTAERALRAAGLTLGQIIRTDSAERAETVLGQSPGSGVLVARGTAVDLQVASGSNAVPATAGLSAAAAVATLESAGFAAAMDQAVVEAGATVLRTEPEEGTILRLGVTVALVLDPGSIPTQTPSAPASGTPTASTPP